MKIVFMGTPQAAVPSFRRLLADGHNIAAVYTQPDRPAGRGNRIVFSPVKEAAMASDRPVFQPAKVRTPDALDTFLSHKADMAVVVAYGRILPEGFLTAFPCGAINVHFSLLPKYRGAAPVNWAIVNGEAETGVTTIQMEVGLDTGPILLQRTVAIGREENSLELMARLSLVGADLLSETVRDLKTLARIEQDHSKATFAPIMKRDDGLIDWSMSAADIANRIRGFQPFPTAFTLFNGSKLTLWKAESVAGASENSRPGTVTAAHGDILTIVCGGCSILKAGEVQVEGKRRMTVREFLNGSKLVVGTVLG